MIVNLCQITIFLLQNTMSTHDLLDKLDGIQAVNRANLDVSVYPESVSRLHRGLGGVNNKVNC